MKISILLLAVLMVGCRVKQASPPLRSDGSVVGSYYRGDGTGYNIYLDLLTNGTYAAKWRGCLGEYGTARGTWTTGDGKVVLSPLEEMDMLKGHLRELHIVQIGGQTVLVPDLRDDYYRKYGADGYAAFHRQTKK
jgi:hypothetical protein